MATLKQATYVYSVTGKSLKQPLTTESNEP